MKKGTKITIIILSLVIVALIAFIIIDKVVINNKESEDNKATNNVVEENKAEENNTIENNDVNNAIINSNANTVNTTNSTNTAVNTTNKSNTTNSNKVVTPEVNDNESGIKAGTYKRVNGASGTLKISDATDTSFKFSIDVTNHEEGYTGNVNVGYIEGIATESHQGYEYNETVLGKNYNVLIMFTDGNAVEVVVTYNGVNTQENGDIYYCGHGADFNGVYALK